MANKLVLLCLLILCSSIYESEGRRGGSSRSSGRSSSSSRGGSSWGKGWGGGSSSSGGSSSWSSGSSYKPSSSRSSYKPSTSWSSGSSYKPSSSRNTGSSSGSSWWGSSSSSGSHKYPSSSTGLSGSNSGSHSYPPGTGLSGSGSGSRYGTGSHGYPSGTGLSGSNKPIYSAPPHTWHTSSSSSGSTYYQPPIIHYPQNVYVTQYKDSGSRYGDLLTGLTLYNMGRSHSHHYHDHYYYDDYYRHRYYDNYNSNSGSSYRPSIEDRPKDEAVCNLRIVENGKVQLLKIPCEVVSTFTEGGKKVNMPVETTVNKTVCTSNSTVIKKNKPEIVKIANEDPSSPLNNPYIYLAQDMIDNADKLSDEIMKNMTKPSVTQNKTTPTTINTTVVNKTKLVTTEDEKKTFSSTEDLLNYLNKIQGEDLTNSTSPFVRAVVQSLMYSTPAPTPALESVPIVPVKIEHNVTEGNKTIHIVRKITPTEESVNVTVCETIAVLNATDPLKVKGAPIDPAQMECSVDIKTKDTYFRNPIDCNTLMQYAKKPLSSPKQNSIMPERQQLKKWLEKPPWWMSMFIAV